MQTSANGPSTATTCSGNLMTETKVTPEWIVNDMYEYAKNSGRLGRNFLTGKTDMESTALEMMKQKKRKRDWGARYSYV